MAEIKRLTKPVPEKGVMLFEGPRPQLEMQLTGRFNTFRHGTKWIVDARVGDVIDLRGPKGEDYGRGVVTELLCGVLENLLSDDTLVEDNHANFEEADELRSALLGVYGKEAVRRGETYTVVYLVRVND